MCGTTYSSLQSANTLNYRRTITHRAIASLYCTFNGLSLLTKLNHNQQRSRHVQFDSKIFESANSFRIDNLEASQVPK